MRTLTACIAFIVTLAQPVEPTGAAAIMEALLYGFEMAPADRTTGLPSDAKRSLARYRQRERSFKPTIPRPSNLDGPEGSVYFKRVGLERALFGLIDRLDSLHLAEEYSTQIALLYEWEGFADSPLTEDLSRRIPGAAPKLAGRTVRSAFRRASEAVCRQRPRRLGSEQRHRA